MATGKVFESIVAATGTYAELAKRLGVSPQSVSNWRSDGVIPARYCKAIEALSGVSVKELRPNDWRHYWPDQGETAAAPELIGADGAPDVPADQQQEVRDAA